MAEGLVSNLPPISNFLHAAALCDTQQVNFTNISREPGMLRETVRGYFGVFQDPHLRRNAAKLAPASQGTGRSCGQILFLRCGRGELLGAASHSLVRFGTV